MRYLISTIAFLSTCLLGVALAVIFTPLKSKLSTNDQLTVPEPGNSTVTRTGDGIGPRMNDPSFGEMGCAKTATADAIIIAPSYPQKPDYLVTSKDNKYDHGTPCPDQFIVEVQNTLLKPPFWIVGADADGDWPNNEIGCKTIRIEITSYGLVPFYGWVKHYQYTVRGKWQQDKYGYWRCETVYIDAPPPRVDPPHYYFKMRVATKVTTFFGKKMRARGGIVFG